MRICGLTVICDATATVGSCFDGLHDGVVGVDRAERDLVVGVHSAGIGLKPVLGPPARTSTLTPVSTPCATSGPVTDLVLVSTV